MPMTTSPPPGPRSRPSLVQPELAARVPSVRQASVVAVVIGALTAVAIIVQATATPDGTETRQSAILDVIGHGHGHRH